MSRTVDVAVGPMLARRTCHVEVTVSGVRFATLRLRLAGVLFRLAGLVGGFGGVEMRIK